MNKSRTLDQVSDQDRQQASLLKQVIQYEREIGAQLAEVGIDDDCDCLKCDTRRSIAAAIRARGK
jgi:hypothetical protein